MTCCRHCDKCGDVPCGFAVMAAMCILIGLFGGAITFCMYLFEACTLKEFLICVMIFVLGITAPIWWMLIWKWQDILHCGKEEEL